MELLISPLTKEQTANMPKFNNLEAHLNTDKGLSGSFWDKAEDIIGKVDNYADKAGDFITKIQQNNSTANSTANNLPGKSSTPQKSNIKNIALGSLLAGGLFVAYKMAKKSKK